MDVLETLRRVDEHFQRVSGFDIPEMCKVDRNRVPHYSEHREIWKEVRRTIAELERNGRPSGSAGRHSGTACGPSSASDAANLTGSR